MLFVIKKLQTLRLNRIKCRFQQCYENKEEKLKDYKAYFLVYTVDFFNTFLPCQLSHLYFLIYNITVGKMSWSIIITNTIIYKSNTERACDPPFGKQQTTLNGTTEEFQIIFQTYDNFADWLHMTTRCTDRHEKETNITCINNYGAHNVFHIWSWFHVNHKILV